MPAERVSTRPLPAQRRHTLHFLRHARSLAPVFLDTEADLGALVAHRAGSPRRYSHVSYVLLALSRVLAAHPEANSAVHGGWRPRLALYPQVDVKLALDKRTGGQRIAATAVLPGVQRLGLDEIQDQVDRLRDGRVEDLPELRGALLLHRLPVPVGRLAFTAVARRLGGRHRRFGTVAVSSLGHRAVDGFHSVGGTTLTVGLGRVRTAPVVLADGTLGSAPLMRVSLAFDHRAVDGAAAADILTELKERLESLTDLGPPTVAPGRLPLPVQAGRAS